MNLLPILKLAETALNSAPNHKLIGEYEFEGKTVKTTYDVAAIVSKAQKEQEADVISMLSAALAFYANPENWKEEETGIGMMPSICALDSGKLAETTLNSLPASSISRRTETP